jgi:hypothetical protein
MRGRERGSERERETVRESERRESKIKGNENKKETNRFDKAAMVQASCYDMVVDKGRTDTKNVEQT